MNITSLGAPEAVAESSLVAAEKVTAGYTEKIVWEDATFSIGRGEFVAVIGPNGAGKTTLFRLLLGLQQPISGAIKIFGEQPKRGNPQIGYVPQRHAVDSETNIESLELVRLGLSGKKWGLNPFSHADRDIAFATLESVGAKELAHRPLCVLSGGDVRRLFLAEALVSNPSLLLLDEPLSNLDMRRESDLLHLVNGVVHKRGVTALLIAHNINPLLPHLD